MMIARFLALVGILQVGLVTTVPAASKHVHPSGAKAQRVVSGNCTAPVKCWFVLWQDLFDRANPNNVRSDWPAPPAQPAQF